MTWSYDQSSGELRHDGVFEGTGYSGTGVGRNRPEAQRIHNTGPIPQGRYKIGPSHDHPHLGPCVMNLEPEPGTDTFGRSAFRVHGDNARHDASEGCIILGPSIRKLIAASGDHELEVLP
jgi:hypothetical protein